MPEKNNINRLFLYHADCLDGTGAAYAAWLKFGDVRATYQPIQYGDPVPESLDSLDVYLLDFSFKRSEMLKLLDRAAMVTVIDHHKSAQKELYGLCNEGMKGIFDMEKSGAVLAHEYFFTQKRVPDLLYIIQDRDLWNFINPNTKYITNYLWSVRDKYKTNFYEFNRLVNNYELNPDELIVPGKVLEDFRREQIEAIKKNAFEVKGILIVNCPHGIHSEVIGELSVGHPYAIGFYITNDKIIVNLRSDKNNPTSADVSKIAVSLGGGGHKNAAGFIIKTKPSASLFFEIQKLIEQIQWKKYDSGISIGDN